MNEKEIGKSKIELEEKLDKLMKDLERVNASFPSLERLDGWVPKETNKEDKIVMAEKR